MITIHPLKIRIGFATNSSSTHSVLVCLPDEVPTKDADINPHSKTRYEFGWQFFTAASNEAKLAYLALCALYNLRHCCPPYNTDNGWDLAPTVIKRHFSGLEIQFEDSYVDHQSVLIVPLNWQETDLDGDYLEALKKFFTDERVVIIGGNDNTGELHPHRFAGQPTSFKTEPTAHDRFVCRYDSARDVWVLFNRTTGLKVTQSLNADFTRLQTKEAQLKTQKAFAPELVDLKITNYCRKECPFCYQDSHASDTKEQPKHLYDILQQLADLRVFEIAFGGGEVLDLPWFKDVVKHTRSLGVVPNFSTAAPEKLMQMPEDFFDVIGTFGVSVRSVEEIEKTVKIFEQLPLAKKYPARKPAFHYIVGLPGWNFTEFTRVVDCALDYGHRIVLLAYKQIGRAAKKPMAAVDILNIARALAAKANSLLIAVDTPLAALIGEELLSALGISRKTYDVVEGLTSCYIDATRNLIGSASYLPVNQLQKFDPLQTKEVVLDLFAERGQ